MGPDVCRFAGVRAPSTAAGDAGWSGALPAGVLFDASESRKDGPRALPLAGVAGAR